MSVSQTEHLSEVAPAVSEVFAGRQSLEDIAFQLAQDHDVAHRSAGHPIPLLQHPKQIEGLLEQVHQYFAKIAEDELVVSYAGEWFLDNFYLIQQNLQQILEDMPSSFYKKLPTLITTEYPRVYILAHAILDTTDASFNLQQIKNFVESYQRVTALTMGELWALPAMLRIRVLEVLATTVIQLAGLPAEPQQITAYSPHLTSDIPAETIVANCVTSLRMLNTQDWKTFFENL
ncbi:MAG TPA: hypothetical protein V6C97_13155, partial [Oculatellaceae cyanobacterium]